MTNSRIKVTDLDFDDIRANLKTYMQGQETFSDYDFDGSALATLLDVLAYNTHYNALYTNLAVNESFIDSASKRSSVVSLANNFGYVPKSATAPKATVNVSVYIENANSEELILPKFTPFSCTYDDVIYTFYTLKDYVASLNGDTYLFESVDIYEGTPKTQLYVCTQELEKFIIPNQNIDTTTIEMSVQEYAEIQAFEKYEYAQNVMQLSSTDLVYFLKELEDQTYQFYFGRNGLGKEIFPGNVITVTYIITNKDAANGASSFTYSGEAIAGIVTVSTTTPAIGGADQESTDEIKYNVTKSHIDQNRAVTEGDYESIIKRYYPDVRSISVWGGENNIPKQYGKVFISIRPSSKEYLTPFDKNYITNSVLKNKNVVSITPEIVDPDYLQLEINCGVYYDSANTTRSASDMITAVKATIMNYNEINLNAFDGNMRMSKLSSAIDRTDSAILSNVTTFKIYKEFTPTYGVASEYKLELNNPIYSSGEPEESILSTGFHIDNSGIIYYLDDDGAGNIRLYSNIDRINKNIVNASIGTVDYATGSIKISGLNIIDLYEPNFYLKIKSLSYDLISVRNQIIDIPESRITVKVYDESTSVRNVTKRVFTSSRS